jgi:hypothetical protein
MRFSNQSARDLNKLFCCSLPRSADGVRTNYITHLWPRMLGTMKKIKNYDLRIKNEKASESVARSSPSGYDPTCRRR